MIKSIVYILITLSSLNAIAGISDCTGMYVGSMSQRVGYPLTVVFLDSQGSASGSHDVFFTNWVEEEKNTAVSLLLAAKMSGHKVNIETTEVSKCDITTGYRTLSFVQMTNNT